MASVIRRIHRLLLDVNKSNIDLSKSFSHSTTFNQLKQLPSIQQLIESEQPHSLLPTLYDNEFPKEASIVICGAGLSGACLAYCLSVVHKMPNVVVVEKSKRVASGFSWMSGGLATAYHPIYASISRLCKETLSLYEQLSNETRDGYDIEFNKCGSVWLAKTNDRFHVYRRFFSKKPVHKVDCHLLTPKECARIIPEINIHDVVGGLHIPDDGTVNVLNLTFNLLYQAKMSGAKVIEDCHLSRVYTKAQDSESINSRTSYRRVVAVKTNRGLIETQNFANCSGLWSREVGCMSEPTVVNIPIQPVELMYVLAENKVENGDQVYPMLFDPDNQNYIRHKKDCVLVGGIGECSVHHHRSGEIRKFDYKNNIQNWEKFYPLLDSSLIRLPKLRNKKLEIAVTGLDGCSADSIPIMGEVAELDSYYLLTGFYGIGASICGGASQELSKMIRNNTNHTLLPLDVRRFSSVHSSESFLMKRAKEASAKIFSLRYPTYNMAHFNTGRKLRTSPLYTRLESVGAMFGEQMGYEKALWYDKRKQTGPYDEQLSETGFGKPAWFGSVRKEYDACRRQVAIMDMSAYAKLEIRSSNNEALDFLQKICSNDIDKPIGSVIHTGMQNENGGYENDCSIVRLEEGRFLIICPTTLSVICVKWLNEHLGNDHRILISDVTSLYAAIGVVGPKAMQLIAANTDRSLSTSDFPSMTAQNINIACASDVLAMRLTHTGEDGVNLYIPTEYALHVYDALIETGRDYGLRHAGHFALRSLRIERAMAFWGQDLESRVTPIECNREFRVNFQKHFIGKRALEQQRKKGITKRFVQLIIDEHNTDYDKWPWGGEVILRNGIPVGTVTSASYGFTLNKQVCLGFIQNVNMDVDESPKILDQKWLQERADYQIDIGGKLHRARMNLFPRSLGAPRAR
ncbi:hypothetical protein SNEBB_007970 [Seison nebaliae]|nr:hypothetical protein SNEBB_007970 [Seison nebaliae]